MTIAKSICGLWIRITIDDKIFVVGIEQWSYGISHVSEFMMTPKLVPAK